MPLPTHFPPVLPIIAGKRTLSENARMHFTVQKVHTYYSLAYLHSVFFWSYTLVPWCRSSSFSPQTLNGLRIFGWVSCSDLPKRSYPNHPLTFMQNQSAELEAAQAGLEYYEGRYALRCPLCSDWNCRIASIQEAAYEGVDYWTEVVNVHETTHQFCLHLLYYHLDMFQTRMEIACSASPHMCTLYSLCPDVGGPQGDLGVQGIDRFLPLPILPLFYDHCEEVAHVMSLFK